MADIDLDTRKEMTEKLIEPFPKTALKQRKADFGGTALTYVDGTTVFRRLIKATDNQFTIEVLDQEFRDFGTTRNGAARILLIARVRLTIPGMGSREHVGVQVVNADSGGEDLWKGAVTDAIKKAATLFGVGLELYGPDYEAGPPPPSGEPVSDADFLSFVKGCGTNAERWKEAMSLAGTDQQRWDLLEQESPNDVYKNRIQELRPKAA